MDPIQDDADNRFTDDVTIDVITSEDDVTHNETETVKAPVRSQSLTKVKASVNPTEKRRKKLPGPHLRGFIQKVNGFTWDSVQGKVSGDYPDLSEPDKELYPQLKTIFHTHLSNEYRLQHVTTQDHVVQNVTKGDYVPQDGFNAHNIPPSGQPTDLQDLIEIIQRNKGKPTMIIGPHGSGKTVLMQRLAKAFMIANNLDPHLKHKTWDAVFDKARKQKREYDLVLYIKLSDILNTDRGELSKIIFNRRITGLDVMERYDGLRAIVKKKMRAIIFFDGLDQADWTPNCNTAADVWDKIKSKISDENLDQILSNKKIDPWQRASASTIFGYIVAGKLLPHVPIVVSTSESSFASLPQEMQPDVVIGLTGFLESDAKSLYCDVMGEGADSEWDKTMQSNPAMRSACLSPIFLKFYMIAKKRFPNDPLVGATDVMLHIIEILTNSDGARLCHRLAVLMSLQQIAFEGVKDKRANFKSSDVEKFGLTFDEICDIEITDENFEILTQKLFNGIRTLNFTHQTLQEILAAIFVANMDFESFVRFVDRDLGRPHWSVVRSFACGLLRPRLMDTTTGIIQPSDRARKYDYLIKHLTKQLDLSQSPADKLEILVAMKEGDVLDILRGFHGNLDLSNATMTSAKINVLYPVLRIAREIARISFANSGMDDHTIGSLLRGTEDCNIKIGELNFEGNTACQDIEVWRKVFRNFNISTCCMDIASDDGEADVDFFFELVEAAQENKIQKITFGDQTFLRLSLAQLEKLDKFAVKVKIAKLCARPSEKEMGVWKDIFKRSVIIDHCFVESPEPTKGKTDIDLWLEAANQAKVKEVSLWSTEERPLSIQDIVNFTNAERTYNIHNLCMYVDSSEPLDVALWQKTFKKLSHRICHCSLEATRNDKGEINVRSWLAAAKAIRSTGIEVSFFTAEKNPLRIVEVVNLAGRKEVPKFSRLWVEPDFVNFDDEEWKKQMRNAAFEVAHCHVKLSSEMKDFHIEVTANVAQAFEFAENVKTVSIKTTKSLALSIYQLHRLSKLDFTVEISQLWIKSDLQPFQEILWLDAFQGKNLNICECYIIPPDLTKKSGVDIARIWLQAAETAIFHTVKHVFLASTLPIKLDISGVKVLNDSKFCSNINELWIQPDPKNFDVQVWEEVFHNFKLRVDRCYVDTPSRTLIGFDSAVWINAVKAANSGGEERVTLKSFSKIEFYMADVKRVYDSGLRGEIRQLTMVDKQLSVDDWKQLALMMRKYDVRTAFLQHDSALPDIQSFAKDYVNVTRRYLDMYLPNTYLIDRSRDCGRFISEVGFGEVTFRDWTSDIDMSAFVSGLSGCKVSKVTIEVNQEDFTTEDGGLVEKWVNAGRLVHTNTNVKNVLLRSRKLLTVSLEDIELLRNSGFDCEIEKIDLRPENCEEVSDQNWTEIGMISRKFGVKSFQLPNRNSFPHLTSFVEGRGETKIEKVIFCDINQPLLQLPQRSNTETEKEVEYFVMFLSTKYLIEQPREVGRFISDSAFKDVVVLRWPKDKFRVSAFASGLKGFEILNLALPSLRKKIARIYRKCDVKHIYVTTEVKPTKEISKLVTILSEREWERRFTEEM